MSSQVHYYRIQVYNKYDWKTHYILDEWWGLAREEKSCDECKRNLERVYAPPYLPLRVSNINLSGIGICRHQVKRLLHSNLKMHLTGKDCLQGWSEYWRTLPPRCTIMLRTVYRWFSLVRVTHEKPLTILQTDIHLISTFCNRYIFWILCTIFQSYLLRGMTGKPTI